MTTRDKLLDATIEVVRRDGIVAASARHIAAEAGVSQGSVFYHFDSVENLLVEAATVGARARAETWAARLGDVTDLGALVDLAEELHAREAAEGNVGVLAQFLAGAQSHPALAVATGRALEEWIDVVEPVVARVFAGTPLEGMLEPRALAGVVSDAFIGIELAAATRSEAEVAERFALLRDLVSLVEVVLDLGPVAAKALRRRLNRGRT